MEYPICGGVVEVESFQNSLEMNSLARFAVEDYNKKQNGHLEFRKVVGAESQVVEGIMYHITLEASDDGGKRKVYKTSIWEKPWMKFKEVQNFELLGDAPNSEVHEDCTCLTCLDVRCTLSRWILSGWIRLMKIVRG